MAARGALRGPGVCWLQEVGRQSPEGPLAGVSWLEPEAQGHLWAAPRTAGGATWCQKPRRRYLGRRWSRLQSAVERGRGMRGKGGAEGRCGAKRGQGGGPLQPHLDVVQLGPVGCHDEVRASFFQGVTHDHGLGCLPRGLLTVGTDAGTGKLSSSGE